MLGVGSCRAGEGLLVLIVPFLADHLVCFFFLVLTVASGHSCSVILPVLSPVVPGTYPDLLTSLPTSLGGSQPPK